MKKLLVILFALALVFSFTAPVMATDVSFDGSYRIRGFYDSNSALVKDNAVNNAYYDQRFRLQTVFQVAEGLKVTARFDAMDGTWGDVNDPLRGNTANNIQFDKIYMTFVTGIGQFDAGVMSDGTWGTSFGNLEGFVGKISFTTKVGDVMLNVHTVKNTEGDKLGTAATTFPGPPAAVTANANYGDRDDDSYRAFAIYAKDDIQAGLIYIYERQAYDPIGGFGAPAFPGINFVAASGLEGLVATANILEPYFNATFGDLYLEGELGWVKGEIPLTAVQRGIIGLTNDVELEGFRYYLQAKYNIGSSYVGGLFAYVQGDDPTSDKIENFLEGGGDWDPMLILFNDTCPTSLGTVATTGVSLDNGSIYQVFAGTTIDKLALKASLSMAKADEVVAGWDDSYGTEFDLEAAYKIYDNLTYSAGFGYLWAGDYYKGGVVTTKIDNTYLLMNKLQVVF